MASEEDIREESRRVRRLRVVVDLVTNVIWQSDLPLTEVSEMVAETRRFALQLFPDKEFTYDLIYAPRFRRLLSEKYQLM
jgi:hypothetical protein